MNEDIRCPICGQGDYLQDFNNTCSRECARVAAIVGAIDRLTAVMTPKRGPVYDATDSPVFSDAGGG
jgi:hypothetical protein